LIPDIDIWRAAPMMMSTRDVGDYGAYSVSQIDHSRTSPIASVLLPRIHCFGATGS